jgi:hypothetical protein
MCSSLLALSSSTLRFRVDANGGRILGRNWDKSLKRFPPCYSQSPLLKSRFYSPSQWAKVVCNWFAMLTLCTETSSLRTLKIMPRNLNKIVRSWIQLLISPKKASLRISYDQMIESYRIYPTILNLNLAPVYPKNCDTQQSGKLLSINIEYNI